MRWGRVGGRALAGRFANQKKKGKFRVYFCWVRWTKRTSDSTAKPQRLSLGFHMAQIAPMHLCFIRGHQENRYSGSGMYSRHLGSFGSAVVLFTLFFLREVHEDRTYLGEFDPVVDQDTVPG